MFSQSLPLIEYKPSPSSNSLTTPENINSERRTSIGVGVALFILSAGTALTGKRALGVSGMFAGWQLISPALKTRNKQFNFANTIISVVLSLGVGKVINLIPTTPINQGRVRALSEKGLSAAAAATIVFLIKQRFLSDTNDKEKTTKMKMLKEGAQVVAGAAAGAVLGEAAAVGADLCTNDLVKKVGVYYGTIIPEVARGFASGATATAGAKAVDAGFKVFEEKKSGKESERVPISQTALDIIAEGAVGAVINTIAAVPTAKEAEKKVIEEAAQEAIRKAAREKKDLEDKLNQAVKEKERLAEQIKKQDKEHQDQLEAIAKAAKLEQEKAKQIEQEQQVKKQAIEAASNRQLQELNQSRTKERQEFAQKEAELLQAVQAREKAVNAIRRDLEDKYRRGYHDTKKRTLDQAARDFADGKEIEFKYERGSSKGVWKGKVSQKIPDRAAELNDLKSRQSNKESEWNAREASLRADSDKQIQALKTTKNPTTEPVTTSSSPTISKPKASVTAPQEPFPATAAASYSGTPQVPASDNAKLPTGEHLLRPNALPNALSESMTLNQMGIFTHHAHAYSGLTVQGNKKLTAFKTKEGPSNILHALLGTPDEEGIYTTDAAQKRQEMASMLAGDRFEAYRNKLLDLTQPLTVADLKLAAACFKINLIVHCPGPDFDYSRGPLKDDDERILLSTTINPENKFVQTVHLLFDGKNHYMSSEIPEGFNYIATD